jgi:hypothetical protein
MRFLPEQQEGRREFLRDFGRYTFLGLLALVAAFSRKAPGLRQRCLNRGLCGGCLAFSDCQLPRALSVKRAEGSPGKAGGRPV